MADPTHPFTHAAVSGPLTVRGDHDKHLTWTPDADGLSGTWSGDPCWILQAELTDLLRRPLLVLQPDVYVERDDTTHTSLADAAAIMIAVTGNRCDTTHLLVLIDRAGKLPTDVDGGVATNVVY